MNKFRLLRADEIECRISSISEKGLSLLLYKTARTDANLLDETVGAENWQNDFKVVDGVLYGGISIRDETNDDWIEKWDAGTESNTEAEKGRASDAFKRAGFKWGIGRELYTAPFIFIAKENCNIQQGKNGKFACYDTFTAREIGYSDAGEINKLVISNDKIGVDVFHFPRYPQKQPKSESKTQDVKELSKNEKIQQNTGKQPREAPDGYFYCEACGNVITDFMSKGKKITQREFATNTLERYGKQLCKECATKAKNESKTD